VLAAGVRDTFAVDEEAPVDLPLSSLLFIVIASYVSLSTLCFYLPDKNSLLLEAKYSVRNSARPS
jgi:hypothetical protein